MFYVLLYLAAIVGANLIIATFGPSASIVTALLLIGLDLSLRDKLHDRWQEEGALWLKMGTLIAVGSLLSYLLNADTARIAIASCAAFGLAAAADALVYGRLIRHRFLVRANGSNVAGALLDSIVFPSLAFGALLPWIIAGQFAAKVVGGALWAFVLDRVQTRRVVVASAVLVLAVMHV